MHLRCGGIVNDCCIANFLEIVTANFFLKIGQYLTKLCVEQLKSGFTFLHTLYRPKFGRRGI